MGNSSSLSYAHFYIHNDTSSPCIIKVEDETISVNDEDDDAIVSPNATQHFTRKRFQPNLTILISQSQPAIWKKTITLNLADDLDNKMWTVSGLQFFCDRRLKSG
jgi:hypothetical protein